MKNIHILQTDRPSRLHLWTDKNGTRLALCELEYSHTRNTQNLYITSEEEIKEGEWYLYCNQINKRVRKNPKAEYPYPNYQKITLTTDQDLIKDGVQSVDDKFLEWVIKNPTCEEVEIKKTDFETTFLKPSGKFSKYYTEKEEKIIGIPLLIEKENYKIIIPQEPEQEKITINQFPSESVELFNQNNKSLGLINELQLLDVQCQIAEKRLEGYYVKMCNLRCEIDNCGELKDWDGVTFHREYMLLTKLKRIQQKHGKNKIY